MKLISQARSYGGKTSESDHKIVKAKMCIGKWTTIMSKKSNAKQEKINISDFCDPVKKNEYISELSSCIENIKSDWKSITQKCIAAAKKVVGIVKPTKKSSNSLWISPLSRKN